MTGPTDRDDLFLDALEHDEDVAWKLAAAAARPASPALRERIVARHRRRGFLGLRTPMPVLAAVTLAAVMLPLVFVTSQMRGELDRERALRDEYSRVLAAVADGAVVRMHGQGGRPERGVIVLTNVGQIHMILDVPQPPPGKAYEAWIIRDGQPLRAGMLPARSGVVTLVLERQAQGRDLIAVTLEVAAGVDQPTSAPVLDVGLPFF